MRSVWIKILFVVNIIVAIGEVITGIALASEEEWFLWFLIGLVSAFLTFSFGMVVIDFLCNVETIREKIEILADNKQKSDTPASSYSAQAPGAPPKANVPVDEKTMTLKKYEQLYKSGAITKSEYEDMKKSLGISNGDTYFSRLNNEKAKENGYWVCKKCGRQNPLNARSCKDCGEYK